MQRYLGVSLQVKPYFEVRDVRILPSANDEENENTHHADIGVREVIDKDDPRESFFRTTKEENLKPLAQQGA